MNLFDHYIIKCADFLRILVNKNKQTNEFFFLQSNSSLDFMRDLFLNSKLYTIQRPCIKLFNTCQILIFMTCIMKNLNNNKTQDCSKQE